MRVFRQSSNAAGCSLTDDHVSWPFPRNSFMVQDDPVGESRKVVLARRFGAPPTSSRASGSPQRLRTLATSASSITARETKTCVARGNAGMPQAKLGKRYTVAPVMVMRSGLSSKIPPHGACIRPGT